MQWKDAGISSRRAVSGSSALKVSPDLFSDLLMGAFTEHCIECNAGADAGFNHRFHDSGDGFLTAAAGSGHGVVESVDDSGVGHVWDGGGTPRLRCPNCTPSVTA
jgi:hypothetical protein